MAWIILAASIVGYLLVGVVVTAALIRYMEDSHLDDAPTIGFAVIVWPFIVIMLLMAGFGILISGTVKAIARRL
jgi:4-hydroxybenzoate polyprenyltransferase